MKKKYRVIISIVSLLISILATEMLIMYVLDKHFPEMGSISRTLVDSFTLMLLLIPAFYVFAYLPARKTINELQNSQAALLKSKEILKNKNKEYEELNKQYITQNEEMKKLNSDKDIFLTIMAHDLKSPFNSLLGFSEILSENIRKFDIDKIENFARLINASAHNTYNLLIDLLQWVRAQSGKIPFVPQKLNFTDIYNNVYENLYLIARNKEITINYSGEEDLYVFADKDMIKTILRNLISNAIKFTNRQGQINISANSDQKTVTISVKDNGIGLNADTLKDLFEISKSQSRKGTENEGGTGLGLFLCKNFIEAHGGKIWVESTVGKGTEFIFTIPGPVKQ